MIENVLPDIPRFYTALAEWSACLVYIVLLKHRFSKSKLILLSFASLAIQSIFLVLTGDVSVIFWIPCMFLAVFLMIGFIYSCCDISKMEAAYFGIQAFVAAEFMASLEWQIYNYFWSGKEAHFLLVDILFLAAVYGCVNLIMWKILKKHLPHDGRMEIGYKELLSALIIGIAAFAISNLSFLTISTPFSGQYSFEIANIRTLVDLGGIAMLYAHLIQCFEVRVRRELESVENVLQNQYQQYKQSRESIELINYKYHDLKHQIAVLRMEDNPEKRNEYLNKMEEEIKMYELQNKTGNKVLDTLLTSKSLYCNKHGITLTCVADGSLLDFMDVMDICSVFGNALDNAIECEKMISDKEKRLIHVTVSKQKSFLIIRFENYYEGELKYKEGRLVTTKKNKEFHGYGIKSIKYIASKYEGGVSINTENNWFDLKILIPIWE